MDERDVLWGMYQEHCTQGRHHEEQRASVTNLIIALSAAMTGLLTFKELSHAMWPLAAMIVLLGLFGALFSLKHYERFRFHMKCAGEYRNALEQLLPASNLAAHRQAAKAAHGSKYRIIAAVHLFLFWLVLNLVITALGSVLLSATLRLPAQPSEHHASPRTLPGHSPGRQSISGSEEKQRPISAQLRASSGWLVPPLMPSDVARHPKQVFGRAHHSPVNGSHPPVSGPNRKT